MLFIGLGRVLRMLRLRKGWRQSDVAARARISPSAVGRHENGIVGSLAALETHAAAFGLRLDVRLTGRAGALVRLADEEHARIVEIVATRLSERGFVTETEASFSEWGERGRIDLLAFLPASGTIVIVEVKTQLLDLQDLFGGLNVKERLAATIAKRRGWIVRHQATLLAVANTPGNRARVREHPTLFADFARSRLGDEGLRSGRRLLLWVDPESERGWLAGRQRVSRKAS